MSSDLLVHKRIGDRQEIVVLTARAAVSTWLPSFLFAAARPDDGNDSQQAESFKAAVQREWNVLI